MVLQQQQMLAMMQTKQYYACEQDVAPPYKRQRAYMPDCGPPDQFGMPKQQGAFEAQYEQQQSSYMTPNLYDHAVPPSVGIQSAPTPSANPYEYPVAVPYHSPPQQKISPVHMLIAFANDYLTKARAVAPFIVVATRDDSKWSQDQARRNYNRLIIGAIGMLELALKKGPLPEEDSKIRLKLAEILSENTRNYSEAIAHIEKALIVSAKQVPLISCHLRGLELHAEVLLKQKDTKKNMKMSIGILKKGSQIARERTMNAWYLRILVKMADIHARLGDYHAASEAIREGKRLSECEGCVGIQYCLKAILVRYAAQFSDYRTLDTIIAGFQSDQKLLQAMNSETSDNMLPVRLQHYIQIMITIWQLHIGEQAKAVQTLKDLQASLQQHRTSSQDNCGTLQLEYRSQDHPGEPTGSTLIQFNFPSGVELYAFGHLLSGLCTRANTTVPHTRSYLIEGLKNVDSYIYVVRDPTSLTSAVRFMKSCIALKARMFLELGYVELSHSLFDASEKSLRAFVHWLQKFDMWQAYRSKVLLLKGMLSQARGQFDTAVITNNIDLKTLALVCTVLVQSANSLDGLAEISSALQIQSSNTSSCTAKCLSEYVMALHTYRSNQILQTKGHLLSALSLATKNDNTRLQSLILGLLGLVYLLLKQDQAQSMLNGAYVLSKASKDELGVSVYGKILKEMSQDTNTNQTQQNL
ncbi:hypothetical protein BZG36_00207 [Bifiguratus adelaidae]|uniref:Cohesin loading factor n=1 Tax=Bifiguratus adelaidae TaxID=1938954 RepID=A0A261Y8S0_9FUNG|nr:hypothetical protein BZG36_00207 [Bifiguratus adelaidae]